MHTSLDSWALPPHFSATASTKSRKESNLAFLVKLEEEFLLTDHQGSTLLCYFPSLHGCGSPWARPLPHSVPLSQNLISSPNPKLIFFYFSAQRSLIFFFSMGLVFGLRFEKLVWPWVWGLVRWVDSVVAGLGCGGGVESVVLVWVCDCFSDGFVVGCSRLGGGGSGMWVFFFGVILVVTEECGWVLVDGVVGFAGERQKDRENGDEREKREMRKEWGGWSEKRRD